MGYARLAILKIEKLSCSKKSSIVIWFLTLDESQPTEIQEHLVIISPIRNHPLPLLKDWLNNFTLEENQWKRRVNRKTHNMD